MLFLCGVVAYWAALTRRISGRAPVLVPTVCGRSCGQFAFQNPLLWNSGGLCIGAGDPPCPSPPKAPWHCHRACQILVSS